jgi:hypothetical protein
MNAESAAIDAIDVQATVTALSLRCGRILWKPTGISLEGSKAETLQELARKTVQLFNQSCRPHLADYDEQRSAALWKNFVQQVETSLGREVADSVEVWGVNLAQARRTGGWYLEFLACLELSNEGSSPQLTTSLDSLDCCALHSLLLEHFSRDDLNAFQRCIVADQDEFDRRILDQYPSRQAPTNLLVQIYRFISHGNFRSALPTRLSDAGTKQLNSWLEIKSSPVG